MFSFNFSTGTIEFKTKCSTGGAGSTFRKAQKVVDSGFLTTPEIDLGFVPLPDSETVFLNGLEIDNSNYSIVSNILTMVATQLKVGDTIDINFSS